MIQVLIVEDEEPKLAKIAGALKDTLPEACTRLARSVNSAIKAVKEGHPDLILLDMSLPTYDIGPQESGGQPRGFGGIEVLRYLDRFRLKVPVIVVTAYDAFAKDGGQVDLDSIRQELAEAHAENFRGAVYYNSIYETWREELSLLVSEVVEQ